MKRSNRLMAGRSDDNIIKKSRKKSAPSFKGNRVSLKVPELDESSYIRLKKKTIKNFTAAKANHFFSSSKRSKKECERDKKANETTPKKKKTCSQALVGISSAKHQHFKGPKLPIWRGVY